MVLVVGGLLLFANGANDISIFVFILELVIRKQEERKSEKGVSFTVNGITLKKSAADNALNRTILKLTHTSQHCSYLQTLTAPSSPQLTKQLPSLGCHLTQFTSPKCAPSKQASTSNLGASEELPFISL